MNQGLSTEAGLIAPFVDILQVELGGLGGLRQEEQSVVLASRRGEGRKVEQRRGLEPRAQGARLARSSWTIP